MNWELFTINPKELDIKLLKDRAKITSSKLVQLSYSSDQTGRNQE